MLAKLWQQKIVKMFPRSILGGKTDVAHHFYCKTGGLSMRYYIPNGIPLTHQQHVDIHGSKRAEMERAIIQIRGREWLRDLQTRKNKIVKNINYKKVKDYLEGKIKDYI